MKSVYAVVLAFALQFSQNSFAGSSIPGFSCPSKPTPEQCVKLRSDLDKYIAYINAWLAAQPAKTQSLLSPLVTAAINEAKKLVNKLCPAPSFDPTTVYECQVISTSLTIVSLGLNSSGQLDNSGSPAKVACMSQAACFGSVPFRYSAVDAIASPRCAANPVPADAQHLTDAQVTTLVTQ